MRICNKYQTFYYYSVYICDDCLSELLPHELSRIVESSYTISYYYSFYMKFFFFTSYLKFPCAKLECTYEFYTTTNLLQTYIIGSNIDLIFRYTLCLNVNSCMNNILNSFTCQNTIKPIQKNNLLNKRKRTLRYVKQNTG